MSQALAPSPTPQDAPPVAAGPLSRRWGTYLEIDRSMRGPVLVFFAAAVCWLMVSTLLGVLVSFKLHLPNFLWLDGISWLTFGRLQPAYTNALVYGWASSAGMGVAIWLMGRLCRTPLRHGGILATAAVFWNVGLFVGIMGILGGRSTGIEWLELPGYATPLMFVAYALVGIWAVMMFRFRKPGHVYVSQWYLLAALFWFPWLYATAQILLVCQPVQGTAQAVINWWYADNLTLLWFTPIGLAAAYYFIPKVTGQPVYSYYLAAAGFWTLAFFSAWRGAVHLIGGPVPIWIITVSVVAGVLLIIPVLMVAINLHLTMRGQFALMGSSPTLRFVVLGAMMYTGWNLLGVILSIRAWAAQLDFSLVTVAYFQLGMYAFFSLVMFGAMYYIVPRLIGCTWRSSLLFRLHFEPVMYGIFMMMLCLLVGGLWQGAALNSPEAPFEVSLGRSTPFLVGRSLAMLMLTVGHVAFAWHFFLMLIRTGRHDRPGANVFAHEAGKGEGRLS